MADATSTGGAAGGRMVGALLSDRYRVTSLLGEGGMGEVYLGEHLLMRKRVAIKVLHPEMMGHDEVVARFEREAMAAAHIDHPHVATATDFGRTPEGAFFLVLEYIEGRSLREMLAGLGALPAGRALHVARQVALALSRAHELGIVHRDLKPENVMLVVRGQDPDFVKVLDFGIAKVPVQELTGKATVADPLTRLGVMYGTPEYMAPEQALGQTVDHRADLYALGVMLYEMVAGSRPFEANDPVSLVAQHITAPPQPPSSRNPAAAVPEAVEALVLRLLSKDPVARPTSAQEVIDVIDDITGGPPRGHAPSSVAYGRQPSAPAWSLSPSRAVPAAAPSAGGPPSVVGASTGIEASAAYLPTYVAGAPAASDVASPPPGAGPLARVDAAPGAGGRALAALGPLRAQAPVVVARARASLESLRARLPAPLGRATLPALLAAAALPLVAIVALAVFLLGGPSAPGAAGDGPPDVAVPGAPPPPPSTASAAELDAARSSPEALETLAARYPRDPAVRLAIVRAYAEQRRHREAVQAARDLLALESSKPPVDDVVLQALRAAALAPESEADALATLESLPGPQGPNVLYDLSSAKEVPARNQAAAQRSLLKAEVREKASPALAVFLDFKQARDCEAKRALLPRVIEAGDRRLVPLLKPLQNRRGCGVFRLVDCYPCLRGDAQLGEAVTAAGARAPER